MARCGCATSPSTLNDGSAVVNEADVAIAPGEKVLVVGESGTGKSTLVRAIAGLWPWGGGEILIKFEGLFLMPQQPYVPLGTLRRATTYPLSPESVDDAVVRKTVEDVGLGHFLDRLDEEDHRLGTHTLRRRKAAPRVCPRADPSSRHYRDG